MAELSGAVSKAVDLPAEPRAVFSALCKAMSDRRGGRPVTLSIRPFPETIASTTGLWLELPEQDVIVIEESLAPDHQLVVVGHELWHMHAGHRGHDLGGAAVAARAALRGEVDWPELVRHVAARSHSDTHDEVTAESFGLLLGSRLNTWLALPGTTRTLDDIARRINASLGYNSRWG
ncbi:toxin-antitoxin system, toxin component [Streptomyces guryensis]|uniref:Toxin-antitoxin system, toxin component n=1 Tax=Streptomyces guryensis TaxID=2886947 RepID=A0A9Q3VPW1_9ACTN|nr:toxin-antitoxin system, toxin component [Streptomyces guryensis]MCD9875657.1 toxin-antitoxin system, toxin component [Streptomyces guryensis]